jgi:hypothetical protein
MKMNPNTLPCPNFIFYIYVENNLRRHTHTHTKNHGAGEINEGEDGSEAMKKKSSTGPPSCALCNNDKAPFQCSQCKTTHYCGVSCQKLDWKAHKKVCNIVRKRMELSPPLGTRIM